MRLSVPFVLCLSLLLTACGGGGGGAPSPTTALRSSPETRFDMAGGCYALRADGGFVQLADGRPVAAGATLAAAEPFFFKATALGRYLLQARDRQLLTLADAGAVMAVEPSDAADFTVQRSGSGFSLFAATRSQYLGAGDQELSASATPAIFTLVPALGCTPYPELDDNIVGETFKGRGVDQPALGFADVHSHVSVSHEFYGGAQFWGSVFHRFGVAHALGDCAGQHGPQGIRDGNNIVTTNPTDTHDTVGWPTFNDWPAQQRLTHQGAYYKWLQRTWKAGLRLIVMNGTNIDALCQVGRTAAARPDFDCDDMRTAEAQLAYQRAIQDYVDAQEGGPGKGWFRIVSTPAEARAVINQGKLAVVPGVEVAHIFNCKVTFNPDGSETAGCDQAGIDSQIQRLKALGVRQLFPIHDVDSALGGTGIFNGNVINLLNFYDTQRFWATYDCPDTGEGDTYFDNAGAIMDTAVPGTGNDPVTRTLLGAINGSAPVYPAGKRQCNARGLTALGEYAINRLMDNRIVIEIDHMELSIKERVIQIAKARNYPLVSTHGSHGGLTVNQAADMLKLGGIIYPYKGNGADQAAYLKKLMAILPAGRLPAMGFGSDINGFGAQARPRGAGSRPVTYPFTLFRGEGWGPQFRGIAPLTVNQSAVPESGRKWHVDEEGQAHYGLIADFIEETRLEGGEPAITALYNSAEGYLRMWERTLDR